MKTDGKMSILICFDLRFWLLCKRDNPAISVQLENAVTVLKKRFFKRNSSLFVCVLLQCFRLGKLVTLKVSYKMRSKYVVWLTLVVKE